MAFETGTFTSLSDLVTKIETFCTTSCGYTLTSGVLHSGDVHVTIAVSGANLEVEAGTGSSAGVLTNPSESKYLRGTVLSVGIATYYPITYFFMYSATPDQFTCVITYGDGWCQHMSFGEALKYGTWGGGTFLSTTAQGTTTMAGSSASTYQQTYPDHTTREYDNTTSNALGHGSCSGAFFVSAFLNTLSVNYPPIAGTRGNSSLYCDLVTDSVTGSNWLGPFATNHVVDTRDGTLSVSSVSSYLIDNGINSWSNEAILVAADIYVKEAGESQLIGTFPHTRYMRIDNFEVGQIITQGSDKWICFPHRKRGPHSWVHHTYRARTYDTDGYSAGFGWAVRYDGP